VTAPARLLAAFLLVGAVVGCGGSSEKPEVVGRAQLLWSSRAPYVGDHSRVAALVGEVGVAREGSYSIRLQTVKLPYQLAVALKRPDKPFAVTDFSEQATLLLGLVGNLDQVSVSSGESNYVLTAMAASKDLGYDVKRLGQDEKVLLGYLHKRSDWACGGRGSPRGGALGHSHADLTRSNLRAGCTEQATCRCH